MKYVLTERFSQDALEEYFENQRKIGRRSGKPDAKEYGYNDNTILEFKETFPTLRVIHGDDSTGKRRWDDLTNDTVPEKQQKKINHYDTKKNNSMI